MNWFDFKPPDWYQDPDGLPFLRWWTGKEWTRHCKNYGVGPIQVVHGTPALRRKAYLFVGIVFSAIVFIGSLIYFQLVSPNYHLCQSILVAGDPECSTVNTAHAVSQSLMIISGLCLVVLLVRGCLNRQKS